MSAPANRVAPAATDAVSDAAEPTLLGAWTATLVRALGTHGVDADALVLEAGIDPEALTTEGARLPLSASTRLWDLAIAATGDDALGVEVSRFVRPTTFDALGVGTVASGTLAESLDRCVRFAHVVLSDGPLVTASRRERGRYVYTSTPVPGQPVPHPAGQEAILATLVRLARFLLDPGVAPVEVRLQRTHAVRTERFERFFRCPVHLGADHHRLVFDLDVAERPLPTGSDGMARTADRLAADRLAELATSGSTVDRVRAVLGAADDELPGAEQVAAALAVSGRTLQRRLSEEGTTFRDVVAAERITRAKRLLAVGLGVDAAAHRAGFSDAAALRRAFKRETGTTVGAYLGR